MILVGLLVVRICSIEGCSKKHEAKGFCKMHLTRLKRTGTTDDRPTVLNPVKGTPTHNSWMSMKQRCLNSNTPMYRYYGGRGIKVCLNWMIYHNFLNDLGEKPEGTSLDRINTNANYSCGHCEECLREGWKFNCRWATAKEQARNKNSQPNKTGLPGAHRSGKRYRAPAYINGNLVNLGTFDTAEEASLAYFKKKEELNDS